MFRKTFDYYALCEILMFNCEDKGLCIQGYKHKEMNFVFSVTRLQSLIG